MMIFDSKRTVIRTVITIAIVSIGLMNASEELAPFFEIHFSFIHFEPMDVFKTEP